MPRDGLATAAPSLARVGAITGAAVDRPGAALLLFWDYDTQWGGDRSRSPGGRKEYGALEFPNTERILDLLDGVRLRCCFAVVGQAALPGERPYHDPAQVRRIHDRGHEVASHSFRHEWLPGLDRRALLATLRDSKDALEQCIGAPVTTFIPPFNQPFDYPRALSISLSERREAARERTDLADLCAALFETGYRFCRVAYRPAPQRLLETLGRRRLDRPSRLETIQGVRCVRLNTPGGFAEPARAMLRRAERSGGFAVVYGHPHSLTAGNAQDEKHLVPFLTEVATMRRAGRLEVHLPREIAAKEAIS